MCQCGMCPHQKAAVVNVCTIFLFVSILFLLSHLLSVPFHSTSSSSLSFPSTWHNQRSSSLLHTNECLLHLSYSTPLRKTLTVNHYLRIEWYFQRMLLVPKLFRASGVGIYDIPPESSLLPSFIEWELMSFSLHNQEGLDSRVKYLL